MKKKILAYALSALTCGLFTSCSDWLDINHDPNTAEKVDPGYLFNYVAVNWPEHVPVVTSIFRYQ